LFLFNWRTVRAAGNLKVLTKASYVMLALVPILAGVWHGVKLWANQSREQVSHAVRDLDDRAARREETATGQAKHELERLRAATKKLNAVIDRGELDPKLPSAWAVAFFAALCVVFGHLIYQIFAPELVQTQTAEQYAKMVVNEFSMDKVSHDDDLIRAVTYLRDRAIRLPSLRHPNLVGRYGRVEWIPGELRLFEYLPARKPDDRLSASRARLLHESKSDTERGESESRPDKRKMLIAVEEGARAEYEMQSTWWWPAAGTALLFYVAAAILILFLIVSQCRAVASAAGWM
jgi:hypothetical protein